MNPSTRSTVASLRERPRCKSPQSFRSPVAALRRRQMSTAIESCTGLGVNPRGWTVGVGWIDRLRVSGCIHTLEFLRRPVAEGVGV